MKSIHHFLPGFGAVFFALAAISLGNEIPDTGPRLPGPFPMRQWTPPPPPEPLTPVPVLRETEYVLPSEGRSVIVQEITPPAQPEPPPAPPGAGSFRRGTRRASRKVESGCGEAAKV
jgi:hypothetical protein